MLMKPARLRNCHYACNLTLLLFEMIYYIDMIILIRSLLALLCHTPILSNISAYSINDSGLFCPLYRPIFFIILSIIHIYCL